MDPEAIAGNILRAKRDYGISYLFFTDSVFNISPEYNVRLAETLIRRRTDIRWGAYFSPRGIDAEQMRLFRASGLTHIEFGTESFCDRTLEAYGKFSRSATSSGQAGSRWTRASTTPTS